MARYCRYCGGVVDENTGVCTKCHKQVVVQQPIKPSMQGQTIVNLSKKELKKLEKQRQKQIDEQRKQNEKDARPIGKKISSYFLQMFGLIFVLSILALGIIGTLQYYGIINIPALGNVMDKLNIVRNVEKEDEIVEDDDITNQFDEQVGNQNDDVVQDSNDNDYELSTSADDRIDIPDVEEFFKQNSTILNVVEANNSDNVYTEADAYTFLHDRGFSKQPITYRYSIDGEIEWDREVIETSDEYHPTYYTYYDVDDNNLWYIQFVNGYIMATPIIIESNYIDFSIYVTEDNKMMSYDIGSNKFYETIPNDDFLKILVIDKLDSSALNLITYKDLKEAD